jgi:hypothetical protein
MIRAFGSRSVRVPLLAGALVAAGLLASPEVLADDGGRRYGHHRHGDDDSSDGRGHHRHHGDDSSDDRSWDRGHRNHGSRSHGHHRHPGRYGHDWRWDDRHHHRPVHRFHVPVVIASHHYDTYAPYHHGSFYHPAHRHDHEVYYFPVLVDGAWHRRPHAYCGGRLFDRQVTFHGRRVSFGINF